MLYVRDLNLAQRDWQPPTPDEEQAANLRHTVYRLESELGHQRAIAMAAGPDCTATLKVLGLKCTWHH